ncbi:MAG: NOP58 family protein [Methanimicrococcus sp.]|nr:NOP58 family protein [Methanimicrococcus sp.]
MSEQESKAQFSSWFAEISWDAESGFFVTSVSPSASLSTSSSVSSSASSSPLSSDFLDRYLSFTADSKAAASNGRSIAALKSVFQSEKPDYRMLAVLKNIVSSDAEYVSLLRELSIRAVRKQLSESLTEDKKIIQAVEALDDLNETINHLTERLTEWYGFYYPELNLPGEAFVQFVSETPEKVSASEMGAPLTKEDSVLLQAFAGDISALYKRKTAVESFISLKMNQTAPNLSQIAGVVLGARLLSMAGGLKNLASMPSGSIQVMGAAKAMIKHLRANAPSPKHGIIFSHPILNTAPLRVRGKIARAFSASISLAARTDCYSQTQRPEIEIELIKKVNRIKQNDQKAVN